MAKNKKWAKFGEQMKKSADWYKVATDVLGIKFAEDPAGKKNWVKCFSIDGNDERPSASFNIGSGYYKDFRDGRKAISSYDLMIELGKAKDFGDARKQLADIFAVKYPEVTEDDPEFGVKWIKWNGIIAQRFCDAKEGITLEGLRKAGAQLCQRHHTSCIALPITGGGWMFMPSNGQPFPKSDAKSVSKMPFGVEPGLLMEQEIIDQGKQIWVDGKPVTFYWVEGGPDFLAALSTNNDPMRTFVTNPHGCAQKCNATQRDEITDGIDWVPVRVVADLDIPGVMGAWNKIEGHWLRDHKILRPEGVIDVKHGKDLRDLIVECNFDLDAALANLVPVTQEDANFCLANSPASARVDAVCFTDENGNIVAAVDNLDLYEADSKAELNMKERKERDAEKRIQRAGIRIIRVEPGGTVFTIRVLSNGLKRKIQDLSYSRYETWIQICGYQFMSYVVRTDREAALANEGDNKVITFQQFKDDIALLAFKESKVKAVEVGIGIWPGRDEDGIFTNDVVASERGCTLHWNGEKCVRLEDDRLGSMLYDATDDGTQWMGDTDEFIKMVHSAHEDPAFRQDAYRELYNICKVWNWKHSDMADITVGCFLSSIIQALISWRPTVTIVGETNSGKSTLWELGKYLFGDNGLGAVQAQSTAAGVQQSMGKHSKILMIDEIDSKHGSREQEKLLQIFRVSSRGQSTFMGTTAHKSVDYRVCHIPWIFGINIASGEAADLNRMIMLDMKRSKHEHVTLRFATDYPLQTRLLNLGRRLIASMIVCANESREFFLKILDSEVPASLKRLPTRYRESYAVVYSTIAACNGLKWEEVIPQYLATLARIAGENGLDHEYDHELVLKAILSHEIRLGNRGPVESANVSEILFSKEMDDFRDAGRLKGVGYIVGRKSSGIKVAFAKSKIGARRGLLTGTQWEGNAGAHQYLSRIEGLKFTSEVQSIGGVSTTCMVVDYNALKTWATSQRVIDNEGNTVWKYSADLVDSEEGEDGHLLEAEVLESPECVPEAELEGLGEA